MIIDDAEIERLLSIAVDADNRSEYCVREISPKTVIAVLEELKAVVRHYEMFCGIEEQV